MDVPSGRSASIFQELIPESDPFVIVQLPWNPLPQSDVLAQDALTASADDAGAAERRVEATISVAAPTSAVARRLPGPDMTLRSVRPPNQQESRLLLGNFPKKLR